MSKSSDEIIFCLSDLLLLFLRHKKMILLSSFLISIFVVFIFLLSPINYEVKASFRELQDKEESSSFKDLFISSVMNKSGSEASSVMLSSAVLIPFTEKLGLQVCSFKKGGIFSSFSKNFFENILMELDRPLQDVDIFDFADAKYEGEKVLTIFIRFSSSDCFEILNKEGQPTQNGRKNFPVSLGDTASFTLVKTPADLKLNHIYILKICPLAQVVSFLSENIKIKAHKENRNLLCLSIKTRDRHLGVTILNSLMDQYKKFLISENKDFSKLQLAYLEERQDELNNKLKKDLDEYSDYLSENLKEKGYLTLDQKFEMLFSPHSQYLSNIFSVDLELNRLKNLDMGKHDSYMEEASLSGRELNVLFSQIADLRQEKDSVNLSLYPEVKEYSKGLYQNRIKELDEKVQSIELELAKFQNGKMSLESDLCNESEALKKLYIEKENYLQEKDDLSGPCAVEEDLSWFEKKGKELEAVQKKKNQGLELLKYLEEDSFDKRQLPSCLNNVIGAKYGNFDHLLLNREKRNFITDYIKNHLHLLSLKENLLKDGYETFDESGLDCLDINSAKKTFIEYNASLDEIILQIEELKHGKDELNTDSFEISSLGLILKDTASLDVLNKVAKLSIEIKKSINNEL